MLNVTQISEETAKLAQEIASNSELQSEELKQTAAGLEQINDLVQHNSATAEESAASCEHMALQNNILLDQLSKFKIK